VRLRIKWALLLGLAAGLAWLAAPALSVHRYMPRAVDFEQRLPTLRTDAARKGRVRYRTPTVIAPARFDLVGIADELRPAQIRARESGGDWSDWTRTANGDPVYFGGADELQLRTRGWMPRGRLHFVNVSGTSTEAGSLLTGVRKAINSGFISVAGVVGPDTADALPGKPHIISRAAWGASAKNGGCKPRVKPSRGEVRAAVVHHTVTANDYPEDEAASIVLGICRFHRNGNGWNDIGYNALVDNYGNVYAGRAGGVRKPIIGAHAQGFNSQTTGVATIGTHTSTPINAETRQALVEYLAWKLSIHGLTAVGKTTMVSAGGEASRYPSGRKVRTKKVIGHDTVGLTECPGEELEAELPKLRRLVQQAIEAGGGPAEPPPGEEEDPGGVVPDPTPK
jgi:hypothetical protein